MNTDKTIKKQSRAAHLKKYQFKPGQSGNLKGRPKGRKSWDTLFEEAIKRIVEEKKLPIKDPEVEMVIKAVIEALKGNYAFFRDLMDRKYGKPKEPIELEGGETPIEIIIKKGDPTKCHKK